MRRWISIAAILVAAFTLSAQDLTVRHVMGTTGGFSFRTGTGTDARIGWVSWMARAADGSVYIPGSTSILKVSPTGELGMFAGHPSQTGNVNGDKWAARFWYLSGAAVDANGNLYVGDTNNFSIRKITPAGVVSTLGSTTGRPTGIAVDATGNIFVATESHLIQKFTPTGTRTNFAGSTTSGSIDGTGTAARFFFPKGLVFDSSGNLFVADGTNHLIRKITPAGVVTTFAGVAGQQDIVDGTGTAARFSYPWGITIDGANNLYVTNSPSHVRKITPAAVVTTITPNPSYGYRDGPVSQMRMHTPLAIIYDPASNALLVGDAENSCIRKITLTDMMASTFVGLGIPDSDGSVDGQGLSARLRPGYMTAAPDGYVYFSEVTTIRRFDSDYNVSTFAGEAGTQAIVDGPLASARFDYALAIAADPAGNLYVAEYNQNVIRKITPAGTVSTFAGTAGVRGTWPGTGPTAAFDGPQGITCDSLGNVYVSHNTIISKITPAGVVTTFAGAPNSHTSPTVDGTGTAARFYFPAQMWTDASDNLWVNDSGTIRKITTPGAVVTSYYCCGTQGGGFAFNSAGDLFVSTGNYSIVKKPAGGSPATTIMQNAGSGATDGTTPNASLTQYPNLVFAHGDRFYIGENNNGAIRQGYFALADAATIDISSGPIQTTRTLGVTATEATSYEWSVIVRPYGSTAQIASPSSSSASFTPDVEGWYRLQLIASDGTRMRYSTVETFATCIPPAAPTITQIAGTNPSCPSTSIQLRASAGYASYLWSNGLTSQTINVAPSTQTTYTVIGYSAPNCPSAPSQPWVQQVSSPISNVSISLNGAANACTNSTGGTFTLTVTGGNNNTHTWGYATTANGAITNIAGQTGTTYTLTASHFPGPGTYYLSARSRSACSPSTAVKSNEIVVTISTYPTATIAASGPTTFCAGGSVTLTAPAGAGYTYLWMPGEATTQSIAVTTSGSYTVTVTSASGCSTTSSPTSVTVHPATATPTITVAGDNEAPYEFCEPATVRLTSSAATSYLWSNGATTQFIDVTTTGDYTVTTTDTNGCSASATVHITVKPLPSQPTITVSGSLQLCPGGNVTLTASAGDAWLWSNGATMQSITVSEAGSYSVQTIVNGCTSVASAAQVVSFRAASIAAGGPTEFCDGGSVTLTAGAADSWLWSNGATTQSIAVSAGGTYGVTQSWNDGCSIAATPVVVTVHPTPNPNVTAMPGTTLCPNASVTLSAASGFSSYLWSDGSTQQSLVVTQPGSYSVTVTGAGGCTASQTVSVTMSELATPTVTADGPTTFCEGGSVTLTAPSGWTYLWSNGATTQSITVAQSGAYHVTISNSTCTATSADTIVTVNPNPATPVISGPTSFCEGSSITLTAPAGYASYTWNTGATTPSITVAVGGSYHVTVSNGTCSSTSADHVLTMNPTPATPAISGPTSFCEGDSITLSAPAGYASYSWSTGATTPSITVSIGGTYSVTVSNGSCSSTSADHVATVNPTPATPAISGPTSFCEGSSITLSAPAGYASYSWNTGASTQSITVVTGGIYHVTVSNGTCSSTSADHVVTMNPTPAIPTISGPTAFCEGSSGTLNAPAGYASYSWNTGATTSSITVTTGGTYSVTVSNGFCSSTSADHIVTMNPTPAVPTISGPTSFCEGSSITLTAPAGYASYFWNTGATTPSITVTTGGTYSVTVSNGSCSSTSADHIVTMNPTPAVPTISGPTSFCEGSSITLSAPAGYASYAWNTGATNQSITVNSDGTYRVTVSNGTCSSTSTDYVVTMNPTPATPTIIGPTSFCEGSSITLTAPAGYAYLWNTGATTQSITVNSGGTYRVTVSNGTCSSTSADHVVTMNPTPAVPTISGLTSFCEGSSITLTAPAGYASYAWNTGATTQSITVNSGGTYRVTVSNGTCSSTSADHVVTMNPTPAVPTITGASSFCDGTTTTLTAPAGYASYLWNTGATSQSITINAAGTYRVTVSNGSCSSTSADKVVTMNPTPSTPTITGASSFCDGTTTALTAPAGYASYLWNTGQTSQSITIAAGGTYRVTVSNGSCSATSTDKVVVLNPATVVSQPPNQTIPRNTSTTITATATGHGTVTYQWYRGPAGGGTLLTGQTSNTLNTGRLSKGTYQYWVRATAGCGTDDSNTITITVP